MTNQGKTKLLEKLLQKAKEVTVYNSSDSTFKTWRSLVERTLIKIYGDSSYEVNEFNSLKFFYNPIMWYMGDDFTKENLDCFRRDFTTSISLINSYIEELNDSQEIDLPSNNNKKIEKVFISHASKDVKIVEEIIDILETIGLKSSQIFCSSIEGYGISLGENFLDRLKEELNENVLVVFILSKNFYNSPICLCEMGATWVKTSKHIPIIVPPFKFKEIEGVIPLTQGFNINEGLKLTLFKGIIETEFGLSPIDLLSWERKRDRIIKNMSNYIDQTYS